jgi:hypothetical protein
VSNVQALCLFERGEQLCPVCGVVPIAIQICHYLALPGDVLLAERDMSFSQREMLFEHFPIHLDDPVAQAPRPER